MLIPFTEPASPRYIHINPSNNRVHLLLPIVGGIEIGTDNTCKSVYALQEFFGKSKSEEPKQVPVLNELTAYKKALEFDLTMISSDSKYTDLKKAKEDRLKQIHCYIDAIGAIEKSGVLDKLSESYPDYPAPIKSLMQEESNLYSMVLRPPHPDFYLRTVKRTFSLNHDTSHSGFVKYSSDSIFCTALETQYSIFDMKPQGAKDRLIAAVKAVAAEPVNFKALQVILHEKTKALFGVEVDFHLTSDGKTVQKDVIDEEMYYGPENLPKAEHYINDLLARCVPNLFDTLTESPFYAIHLEKKTQELSILTQFFLGLVNIHCVSQGYGTNNFGIVLDSSTELSNLVAAKAVSALKSDSSVEEALCQIVNENSKKFGLKQEIKPEEIQELTKKFEQLYTTIKDAQEWDEFTLLDRSHSGKFVTHQGSICTDFSEFMGMMPGLDSQYFKCVQDSFHSEKRERCEVPADNKSYFENTERAVDKSIEELISIIHDDEQLKLLPDTIRHKVELERMKSPLFQLKTFLNCVARGQQNEADSLLKDNPNAQHLLLTPGTFTDYSGRTFTCTAYEYAYWSKDKHMCRMLEKHMDDETKTEMAKRIDKMEHIDEVKKEPLGLTYRQHGQEFKSVHFDLTPLKKALEDYVNGYYNRTSAQNKAAWMKVGLEQREVPTHVAREYCRHDRSFDPIPPFDEKTLPQNLIFRNYFSGVDEYSWFPSSGFSPASGLGFDFALFRGATARCWVRGSLPGFLAGAAADLAAVSRLDEVRTLDLTQSRENLNQPGAVLSMS